MLDEPICFKWLIMFVYIYIYVLYVLRYCPLYIKSPIISPLHPQEKCLSPNWLVLVYYRYYTILLYIYNIYIYTTYAYMMFASLGSKTGCGRKLPSLGRRAEHAGAGYAAFQWAKWMRCFDSPWGKWAMPMEGFELRTRMGSPGDRYSFQWFQCRSAPEDACCSWSCAGHQMYSTGSKRSLSKICAICWDKGLPILFQGHCPSRFSSTTRVQLREDVFCTA